MGHLSKNVKMGHPPRAKSCDERPRAPAFTENVKAGYRPSKTANHRAAAVIEDACKENPSDWLGQPGYGVTTTVMVLELTAPVPKSGGITRNTLTMYLPGWAIS